MRGVAQNNTNSQDDLSTACRPGSTGQAFKGEAVALQRLVSAVAGAFPEVAQAYYRQGPARVIALLTEVLERLRERGLLLLKDPAMAAAMLLSMVIAEPTRAAALGLEALPQRVDVDRRVKLAVSLFAHGCASPAKPARGHAKVAAEQS